MMRINHFSIQLREVLIVFGPIWGYFVFLVQLGEVLTFRVFCLVKGLPETLCRGLNQRFLFPNLGETGR